MSQINIDEEKTKTILKEFKKSFILIGIVVLIIIVFNSVTFTVGEAQQAVLSQFGVIKEIVISPDNDFVDDNIELMRADDSKLENVKITRKKGLCFKIPFITKVKKYNTRLFTYISDSERINTSEKKQYTITMYAQWRIANPGLFAITHKNVRTAQFNLDGLVYPAIIQKINNLTADQFISNKDKLNEELIVGLDALNEDVKTTGIEIVDIQVHRTILPPANLESTYNRMIANRAKVAQQLRSEGQEEYLKAVSSADKEARIIESEAIQEAEQVKGEGDAQALEIYAQSYSKDPDFYTYWRSLIALEKSIDEDSTIILDENHPLWNDLLKWIQP